MKRKPRGPKYRNLSARSGAIYYERVWKGRRFCFSTKTDAWDEAAAVRDLYEQRKGIGRGQVALLEAPRFEEFAKRYLSEATSHLAATTLEDRKGLLKAEGSLVERFGRLRLDDIGRRELVEWWQRDIETEGLSRKTGKNRLDALSAVFGYAIDLELLDANPADALRSVLRRRNRTKRGRAEADPARNIRAIEALDELAAFVKASAAQGGDGHMLDMLQLDAGLRLGEALGLRWGDIRWGRDAGDASRSLTIRETRARGRHLGTTKSGRERTVALSRRLRQLLQELYLAAGRPGSGESVLPQADPSNYRSRHFAGVCKAAELGKRRPKDLRDTFASQLLTCGVQLGYVSQQLGHADVAVTARHYAKWAAGTEYREPVMPGPDEVPADLLVRASVAPRLARIAP